MVRVRVTFLLHNVAIFGSCTYQVLTWPCVRSLLFHMLVFYWRTCHVAVGSVSLLHLTMCRIFIDPRGRFLFNHVSRCYLSTFHIFIRPHGFMTSFHVSDFISSHVESWLLRVSCTGSSMCHIFIWSHGLSWFYHVEYNQFVIEVIWDHHYCTN